MSATSAAASSGSSGGGQRPVVHGDALALGHPGHHYGHVFEEAKQEAAAQMDALLGSGAEAAGGR